MSTDSGSGMRQVTDQPSVQEALAAVMADVQAVRKSERNKSQGFNFRGIDTVVNAVGPALRTHGVVVVPNVEDIQFHDYQTSKGTSMRNCVVRTRFRFWGPGGDYVDAVTYGEASDSGDKSVSKAQSVAFRIALLQALAIPTDEPDPDEESHERAGATSEFADLAGRLTAPQRKEMKAWRIANGLPSTSEMTPDQLALSIAKMRELITT